METAIDTHSKSDPPSSSPTSISKSDPPQEQSHSSHTITTVMITHHNNDDPAVENAKYGAVILGNDVVMPGQQSPTSGANRDTIYLQVQALSDVCRICHCGPNTLATPTPTAQTPVTTPKKFGDHPLKQRTPSPHTFAAKKKQEPQDYNLISPCLCSGSLKYVHQCCLQHWIRMSNNTHCEVCKHPYELRRTWKPLWKWESCPMSPGEKKRKICSALFHTVALACVVWSLYVLIDRTVEELNQKDMEWQFWTKIIVEAIGCLGAGILTYVWGKEYVALLVKWITFNRSFVIIGKEKEDGIDQNEQELIQLIQSR